jgi:hypothetical protein
MFLHLSIIPLYFYIFEPTVEKINITLRLLSFFSKNEMANKGYILGLDCVPYFHLTRIQYLALSSKSCLVALL